MLYQLGHPWFEFHSLDEFFKLQAVSLGIRLVGLQHVLPLVAVWVGQRVVLSCNLFRYIAAAPTGCHFR